MTGLDHDAGPDGDRSLDELAVAAAGGDRDALTALVQRVQHPLYRFALRFLGHPQDAQDATQEILVLLVTRLATFEGRSAFMTLPRPPRSGRTSAKRAPVSPKPAHARI